ncbi:MAG: FumA C-terminus/TtdB family hydratase beta subunit [Kiritimatiellaeota bacterium]|nr:FumA C-terminus/TtdB family hydratase beta subunit [Kiritimatiellota bacterium]
MKKIFWHPSDQALPDLRAGDGVSFSGRVWTARDRVCAFLANGGESPVSLRGGTLFHCGPVMVKTTDGWRAVAAGPTTSARANPYMPRIIAGHGVRAIIGKGGMDAATQEACVRFGCVYLQAVGGAAALIARCVTRVAGVHFLEEFGEAEAMWGLDITDMPLIVGMDAHGGNLYAEVAAASRKKLDELLT